MPSNPRPSIAQLFTSFLRLGATAFGGPSMVAYIRRLAVEKRGWLDAEALNDGVALCQMIPGATAMQMAGYVGLKTRGIRGAGASFVGFGLPAFLLMMALAALYTHARGLPVVVSVFSGLHAIIVAIVANATLSFGRTTLKGWRTLAIAIVAAALFGLKVNPLLAILAAAVGGLALVRPAWRGRVHSTPSAERRPYTRLLLLILATFAAGLALLFFFNRPLFHLALLMFRIDLFAFGGGFASVPLMLHEIVQVRHWLDSRTFMDGIVLGQVTPGPIVITATFVGYVLGGPLGGLVATASIFLPSFVVLAGVSPHFDRLRASPIFNRVISGVLCSFVGLLLTVTVRFAMNVQRDLPHLLLAGAAFVALLLRVDILWVVVAGTLVSVVIFT
jgi:chromate transporter